MNYRTSKSPRQVFGIGLGKTGTTSLNEALNILGYRSKHYPRNLDYINNGTYNAATDTLIALEYEYLYKKFPESKFICTIRNKEQWLDSFARHFQKEEVMKLSQDLVAMKMRKDLYGTNVYDRNIYADKFSNHVEEIIQFFTYDMSRIIFMNVTDHTSIENWDRLCKYLRCNFPKDVKFPHLNK